MVRVEVGCLAVVQTLEVAARGEVRVVEEVAHVVDGSDRHSRVHERGEHVVAVVSGDPLGHERIELVGDREAPGRRAVALELGRRVVARSEERRVGKECRL